MKKAIFFIASFSLVVMGFSQACLPNANVGSIIVQNDFCIHANAIISFNANFPIVGQPNWGYTGTFGGAGFAGTQSTWQLNDLLTGGSISISGTYFNGFRNCPFTKSISIFVHNPGVTITSPVQFVVGTNTQINATTSGLGTPPAIIYSPNEYFVLPSLNTDEDPTVSPLGSIIYTATVNDPWGCASSATVDMQAQPYAALTEYPDGAYYKVFSDKLMFKINKDFTGSTLDYKVLNNSNSVVASTIGTNILNTVNSGEGYNQYYLNTSSLLTGSYLLVVTNEKNENVYLRFTK